MASINMDTGKIYPSYGGRDSTGVVSNDKPSSPSTSSDASSQTTKESNNKTKAQVNEYVEGTITFLPNSDYTPRKIYKLNGVGNIFHGMYYTKKVTHTISSGGYTVEGEVLMVQKIVQEPKNSSKAKKNVELEVKSPDNPSFKIITIKNGDTIWELSRKYGCTVDYLADINNLKNPDLIITGSKLKVPSN